MTSSSEQRQTLTLGLRKRRSSEIDDEEEEEREIEELEREVKELGEKILESRRTMPERILEALSSHLVAQRPVIPQIGSISSSSSSSLMDHDGQAGTSSEPQENVELKGASLIEADPVMLDMLQKILYLHFSSAELRENAQSSEGISPLEADAEMLNKLPSEGISPLEADVEMLNKLRTFKDKTASNIATMPVILKRINECIARLDGIDQYDVNLHSAFKRKWK